MITLESSLNDEIMEMTLLHIPHSSKVIPDYDEFEQSLIKSEIELLTDHSTDLIFNVDKIERLIFPYSRIYCDVERLPDEKEEMYKYGRGFYYTKTDSGLDLRTKFDNKQFIFDEIYISHHKKLENMVRKRLSLYGRCFIIDCHSFPDKPFKTDIKQTANRPDVCIGIDNFHTPDYLINKIKDACDKFSFSYDINNPYEGTIVPLKYYKKESRVHSVMIEINRKLYINDGIINNDKVEYLKSFINLIFMR